MIIFVNGAPKCCVTNFYLVKTICFSFALFLSSFTLFSQPYHFWEDL